MKSRRWSDLSPNAKRAIVVAGAVELVLTSYALWDLARRPASRVRGPKAMWAAVCFVQPIGSPLYLVAGRS